MPEERNCQKCGSPLKPAMLKCMECGTRLSLRPATEPLTRSNQMRGRQQTASSNGAGTATLVRAPVKADLSDDTVDGMETARVRPRSTLRPDTAADTTAADVSTRHAAGVMNDRQEAARICRCPCGARFRFPPHLAGTKRRCRKCGQPLLLPGESLHDRSDSAVAVVAVETEVLLRASVETAIGSLEDDPPADHSGRTLNSRRMKEYAEQLEVTDETNPSQIERQRLAVVHLGKSKDQRALELIEPLLDSSERTVRQAVAAAVGDLGGAGCLRVSLKLLCDSDTGVVRDAVRSLRTLADPRSLRPLMYVGLEDGILRAQVLETLVHIGKTGLSELLSIVAERNPATICDAVKVLGRIGDKRAVPSLLMAMEHADVRLRRTVLEALGLLGDRSALGKIVAAISDPDESVQLSALQAVQRVPDLRAVKPIISILHSTQNSALKLQSVNALATCGSQKAVVILTALLPDADAELQKAIAKALCQLGSPEAAETLATLLEVDDLSVVTIALTGLRTHCVPSTVPALCQLCGHSSVNIRRHAVEALAEAATDDAFSFLEQRFASETAPEVRAALARAFGRFSGDRSIRLLESALRDEPAVRSAAVVSLAKIGDGSVIPALLVLLKDPVPEVRYHAVCGLGKLKADKAVQAIRPMLEDSSDIVRVGAEKALQNLGLKSVSLPLSRRIARKVSGWMPDHVAGALPAATILVPLLLLIAAGGLGWLFMSGSSASVTNAIALAKAKFVLRAGFSPAGDSVILLREGGEADIWDAATGSFKAITDAPKIEDIESLSRLYTKRGKTLVEWAPEGTARSKKPIKLPPSILFEFSADATTATYVTNDSRTAVWDTVKGKPLEELPLAFSPVPVLNADGSLVAGADSEGNIVVLDRSSGRLIGEPGAAGNIDSKKDGRFLRMMFSAEGNRLAIIRTDRLVYGDVINGKLTVTTVKKRVTSSRARFPNPDHIYSIAGSSVTRLDLNTGETSNWLITDRQVEINGWSLSPDQSLAVVSGERKKYGWLVNLKDGSRHELSPTSWPAE